MRLLLALSLTGCLQRPYPAYFPDDAATPVLTGVVYDPRTSALGGTVATLEGENLATTRTVVVGGRNAVVLESADDHVDIELPAHAITAEPMDIGLVTEDGVARLAAAVTYEHLLGDFVADERVSVGLGTVSCPIEQWGLVDGLYDTVLWCGAELGYGDASAFVGAGKQAGQAAELLGVGGLAGMPPANTVAVWGPNDRRPPDLPVQAAAAPDTDAVVIAYTPDLDVDLTYVDDALDTIYATYSWAFAITDWALVVGIVGTDSSLVETIDVAAYGPDVIELVSAAPADTAYAQLGFRFTESYEDGDEETVAFFGSVPVEADGVELLPLETSFALVHDAGTGYRFLDERLPYFGQSNVTAADYAVSLVRNGETSRVGTVTGALPLTGLYPDLMTGDVELDLGRGFEVYWDPAEDEVDPVVVVLELNVYDADVKESAGNTPLWTVRASAYDYEGFIGVPPTVLAGIPATDGTFDANYDLTGLWAELTVARHTPRVLRVANLGDAVVDFEHAVSANVFLVRP
ncbi:MAG: hypothetical protein KC656_04715 [Myxococcales bacterium]|nr:hypothetical protein [Myxococcales bacterium]